MQVVATYIFDQIRVRSKCTATNFIYVNMYVFDLYLELTIVLLMKTIAHASEDACNPSIWWTFADSNKIIDLSGRNLSSVSSAILGNFNGDESTLNLSNNAIKRLSGEFFQKVLLTTGKKTICSLYDLHHLDLSHNYIEEMGMNSFSCLTHLLTLNLTNNRLTALPSGILNNKRFLNLFDASFNFIKLIENGVFLNVHCNLKTVILSHNNITSFEPWPYIIPTISNFDLSYNLIENFTNRLNWSYDLKEPYGTIANLKFNKLRFWHDEYIHQYNPDGDVGQDIWTYNTDLRENPWMCDCNFFYIVQRFQGMILRSVDGAKDFQVKCTEPSSLNNIDVFNKINPKYLICNLTTVDLCPRDCRCQRRPSENRVLVDCSHGNVNTLPETLPVLKQGEKYHLVFDYNNIETLEERHYLSDIAEMSISNNKLKVIDASFLNQTDKGLKLDVSHNILKYVPNGMQHLRFASTDLSGNPFVCDCDMVWMSNWISQTSDSFGKEIKCTYEEDEIYKIVEVTETLLNCNYDIAIALAVTFGLLLMFVMIVIVWAKKCPYETKVLLFIFFRIHPGDKYVVDRQPDTEHDVYISFDETDIHVRQWVLKRMAKRLEQEKPQYKICIRYRDFLPGGTTSEDIVFNMERSRRVLIILSDGYGSNDWCDFECQRAEILLHNKGRIIFVKYHNSTDELLKTEPWKSRMKGRHAFSYGETRTDRRWFWAKLRYELPVKTSKKKNRVDYA